MIIALLFYACTIVILTILYEYIVVKYTIFLFGFDSDKQDDKFAFYLYDKCWAPKVISEVCFIISAIYTALFCRPISEHLEVFYIIILLFFIFNCTVF